MRWSRPLQFDGSLIPSPSKSYIHLHTMDTPKPVIFWISEIDFAKSDKRIKSPQLVMLSALGVHDYTNQDENFHHSNRITRDEVCVHLFFCDSYERIFCTVSHCIRTHQNDFNLCNQKFNQKWAKSTGGSHSRNAGDIKVFIGHFIERGSKTSGRLHTALRITIGITLVVALKV